MNGSLFILQHSASERVGNLDGFASCVLSCLSDLSADERGEFVGRTPGKVWDLLYRLHEKRMIRGRRDLASKCAYTGVLGKHK